METLKEYISSSGSGGVPTLQHLDQLIYKYPWFTMARTIRSRLSGEVDPIVALSLYGRDVSKLFLKQYDDVEVMQRSDREIIESFLRCGEYRITPNESTPEYLPGVEIGVGGFNQDDIVASEDVKTTEECSESPVYIEGVIDQEDITVEIECGDDSDERRRKGIIKPIGDLVVNFIPVEDDEFITEDLAQIYFDQDYFDQAKLIYRRLSLLNPKKSVYFAEIINRIELFKLAREEEY